MKIFVLGGQGFVGFNLIKKLIGEGNEVVVYGRNKKDSTSSLECKYINDEFENIVKYRNEFNDVDVVYHLISTMKPKESNENIEYDIKSNVITTVKLLDILVEKQVQKIIFPSSGGTVYGDAQALPISETHETNPICSYGITKLMIEKYLNLYKCLHRLDYTVLRISNPYGPYQKIYSNQGIIGVFMKNILENSHIEVWGDGETVRDYIYIEDVVNALYLAGKITTKQKILNIGSSDGVSINNLIEIIKNNVDKDFSISYKHLRAFDVNRNVLDNSRAKEELSWDCYYSLEEGIKKTWEWICEMKRIDSTII